MTSVFLATYDIPATLNGHLFFECAAQLSPADMVLYNPPKGVADGAEYLSTFYDWTRNWTGVAPLPAGLVAEQHLLPSSFVPGTVLALPFLAVAAAAVRIVRHTRLFRERATLQL